MHRRRFRTLTLSLALTGSAAAAIAGGSHGGTAGHDSSAVGQADQAAQITRTMEVEIADNMRYSPADITVKQGEHEGPGHRGRQGGTQAE